MSRPLQNVNYLTVNVEDYDRLATAARRQRLCRSVSPETGSFGGEPTTSTTTPTTNKASSYSELSVLGKPARWAASGSCNDLADMHAPADADSGALGKAQKKLHRRTHITEEAYHRSRSNTDPGAKPDRPLRIPILTIPGALRSKRSKSDGRALGSLIEQTVQLTSASVGLPSRTASAIDLNQRTWLTPPPAAAATPHLLAPSSLSSLTTASREGRDACRRFSRSTSSVSTLMQLNSEQLMAPLQSCAETHSVTALHATNQAPTTFVKRHSDCSDDSPKSNVSSGSVLEQSQHLQQQQQQQQGKAKGIFSKQLSVQSDYSSSINESFQSLNTLGNTIKQQDNRSLKHSNSSGNFLNPLVPVSSTSSVRSLSPSRKSVASSSGGNTAKHEQSSSAAATPPPEKEKKRKEVSSSRVKKFHRHFSQVSKDEKLINYFSCALVSDILLQGHLYITDQHFAFYSNVFGYVTKVVIPTSSVTKISKEKTAKIIPNAVGVATADERHVFGSFISREAAFRLMCSVCPPLAPIEPITKISPGDIEISEYSIEDDSSCSISGNESPPQIMKCSGAGEDGSQPMMRRTILSSSANKASNSGKDHFNEKFRHSDIPSNAKSSSSSSPGSSAAVRSSMPANAHLSPAKDSMLLDGGCSVGANVVAAAVPNITMIIAGSASSTTSGSSSPTPSTSSLPTTVMAKPKSAARAAVDSIKSLSRQTLTRLKFPTDLYVVYLGVLLSVVLALFSVFLLYRILDIEAKTSRYHSSVDFNWGSASDDDIFSEALRWQKQLQTKSSEEAQDILNTNLQQIAKVRRSLETLSMLIHDRSSAYAPAQSDDRD